MLIEWRRISDSRRFRGNLPGVNLRSFDGTTGGTTYDNVVRFKSSLGALGQIVETFVSLGFPAMSPASNSQLQGSTVSRQLSEANF